MKFKLILYAFLLLMNENFAFAQAIKLTFIEANEVGRKGAENSAFGVGYERNLNNRISIFVSAGMEFPSGNEDNYNYDISRGQYQYGSELATIDFTRKHTTIKLTYESRYFLRNNDDGSWYLASKLSIQNRKETSRIIEIMSGTTPLKSFYDIEVSKEYSQSLFITPLSLTFGHRSNLDGFIFDFNFGYAFLPKNVYDLSIPTGSITEKSVSFYKSVFTFGISIGVGWAEN